ncbi:MAG: trypsin-like peptidase domain-containing protein [Chloroflexi bacterium]|nr:trypsin-like peptidase domain-containing protein [Chloroflexota bacterium]
MKSVLHRILLPAAVSIFIFAVGFGALPLPGIQAIGIVSHPNDIFAEIYQAAGPSVVAISVAAEEGAGGGSGFVIDRDGHIVTNAHVVDEADEIVVEFLEGAIVRAELVGSDPASDLAVLRVEVPADQLKPIAFADSDQLTVGQAVLAIGSPFSQGWTLTSGIISAIDRTIQGLTEFSIGGVIQTDASINPGNSGGPLINLDGEVIGVNSQIISAARSSAGVGFAIPSNLTQRVAESLIDSGEMRYSYLGISGFDVNINAIESLELPNDFRGVVVREVVDDGPASDAGLREITRMLNLDDELVGMRADIITAVDGHPIKGMNDLITYLARHTRPAQEVRLAVLRDGVRELEIPIELGGR